MTTFYQPEEQSSRPKIFGMTASPPKDKGSKGFAALELERTLHSRIITVSQDDVSKFSRRPKETVVWYAKHSLAFLDQPARLTGAQQTAFAQLEALCQEEKKFKSALLTFEYARDALGIWCALRVWKYALRAVRDEVLMSPETRADRRLRQIERAEAIAKDIQKVSLDTDLTLASDKLKQLVKILQDQGRIGAGFCGILFVERRPIVHVLNEFFEECKKLGPEFGLDFIRAAVLTGHGSKGDVIQHKMQLKEQRKILSGFRRGTINLLIATDVAEEGLDIDRCRLVIRFDIKNTLISHIQSRGRARDPASEYIVMQEENAPSYLDTIKAKEEDMRRWCAELPVDRVHRYQELNAARGIIDDDDEDGFHLQEMLELANVETTYIVRSTGARVTFMTAVPLIHQYCMSLPKDAYTQGAPVFELESSTIAGEYHCWLTLPPNSPVREFYSASFAKKLLAKRAVAFRACKELHLAGALNDRLLPHKNKELIEKELEHYLAGGDSADEESTVPNKESLRKYTIRQPRFWDNKITAPTATLNSAPGRDFIRVYVTLVIPRPRTRAFRSLALLTTNKPPQFEPIELFHDDSSLWVDLFVKNTLDLTVQEVSDLHQYHSTLYHSIYRKDISVGTLKDGIRHIIAPLKHDVVALPEDGEPLKQLIDWNEVGGVDPDRTSVDIPSDRNLDWDFLQDKVLFEKAMTGRFYFPKALRSDLTPASPIPSDILGSREESQGGKIFSAFYHDKYEIDIQDQNQPLVEVDCMESLADLLLHFKGSEKRKRKSAARFLVPELCNMLTVSGSVLRSASWMVSVLARLDGLLKADEFLSQHKLTQIRIPLMLEALTTSEMGHAMNYQRLELLGDTFLKFLITLHLYIDLPNLDEGQLTIRRAALVSNKRLKNRARRLGMDRYIVKHVLVNPHFFVLPEGEQWQISHKTMADLMESTLGAAYLSGGFDLGLKTAGVLLGPLENIKQWSDFAKLYSITTGEDPRRRVPFKPTPGLGDLGNVERTIGYKFKDRRHLAEALTHATALKPETACYQRMEFLGDAVLDMLVARHWVHKYPISGPGKLHAIKSASINNQILGVMCIQLGLHKHLLHMSSELSSDIKRAVELLEDAMEDAESTPAGEPVGEFWEEFNYPKVLGDILESLIAAVYVDSDFDFGAVERVFERCIKPVLQKYLSLDTLKGHPVEALMIRLQNGGCTQIVVKNITESLTEPTSESQDTTTSDLGTFWSTDHDKPVVPLQTHAVLIHGNIIATHVHTQTVVGRREVAKKVHKLLDEDPELLSRYCDCRSRNT
ncbi:Dicer-like protein 1 [Mortierella sp. GBA43]|nr:Dicer-like protein 1 [Mortierella sp. GBA43]